MTHDDRHLKVALQRPAHSTPHAMGRLARHLTWRFTSHALLPTAPSNMVSTVPASSAPQGATTTSGESATSRRRRSRYLPVRGRGVRSWPPVLAHLNIQHGHPERRPCKKERCVPRGLRKPDLARPLQSRSCLSFGECRDKARSCDQSTKPPARRYSPRLLPILRTCLRRGFNGKFRC